MDQAGDTADRIAARAVEDFIADALDAVGLPAATPPRSPN